MNDRPNIWTMEMVFLPALFDDCPYRVGETDCVREVGPIGSSPAHNQHDHCISFHVVKWQLSGEDLPSIRPVG